MKRIILTTSIILSLAVTSISAPYPVVNRVFSPTGNIPIGFLNQDFQDISEVFSSGVNRVNFNELYINSSQMIGPSKTIRPGTMSFSSTVTIFGNLGVVGATGGFSNMKTFTTTGATITSSIISKGNVVIVSANNLNANNATISNANIYNTYTNLISATTVSGNTAASSMLSTVFSKTRGGKIAGAGDDFIFNNLAGKYVWAPDTSTGINYLYTATSDIIVTVTERNVSVSGFQLCLAIYTDSQTTPNTPIAIEMLPAGVPINNQICVSAPIKKGNKWWIGAANFSDVSFDYYSASVQQIATGSI